ncbi:MAG: type II toxin-antitoxin system Phd/YefM family antitoxin [Candidatus Hydrogenedentes bacterium]|nr:type II toxin-antitoxin system Phd/YefM family antitoxin [Candidatus Hydrogenedentota bacterium]
MSMKSMPISEFKAHALNVLGEVAKTKQPVLVTKRGKPIAEVVPVRERSDKLVPGALAGTVVFEKDIESPLGAGDWNAAR